MQLGSFKQLEISIGNRYSIIALTWDGKRNKKKERPYDST